MSDDLLDDFQTGTNELPQMLNVLTILTFIGSGLSLLSGLWSFITMGAQKEAMELQMAQMESMGGSGSELADDLMDGVVKTMENAPLLNTVGIIVALMCILGAYQMRKLKKTGFYIYVIACIVGLVVPILVVGGGLMGGLIGGLMGIVSVVFIILYGVKLKHMR